MIRDKQCRIEGHYYTFTTSDTVRRCHDCGKLQIKCQGVWMDKPKEPIVRKPKVVEESQMNMFESLTKIDTSGTI